MQKLGVSLPLPLPRLSNPPPHPHLRYSLRQVPSILPLPSPPLSLLSQTMPLASPSHSFSTLLIQREQEQEQEEEDPPPTGSGFVEDVERVCELIYELFALDLCRVHLSSDLVVEVLRRFRNARKPALRFFIWAGKQPGYAHDSSTYNSMMGILAKTRQLQSMVSLFEEMGKGGVLTMEMFEICIKAFAPAKERKKPVVALFELMKKRYKSEVGVDSFNSLLDCLRRAKLGKEAQALFEKLEGRFVPNLRTCTVLLNWWCKVKDLMEDGRVWNEMIDKGFKPNVVAYNVMLEGGLLLRCTKRSDAIKLFEVMTANGPPPDVQSYTLLIRDLCKQMKVEEAVEYFDEMVDSGCQPDAAVYACLITGFGNKKRMDIVCELLKQMEDKGCPLDGVTYNALIKLMSSWKMPDDVVRIFKKMTRSGIEPTVHSYNMIMKSYFQMRNYEMGHAVWDEMNRKGCCPDDNSYTVLIHGLISQGRSINGCKYLEEMLKKGMKAPQLDHNKFAADFSRAGKPHVLEELAQKMKSHGNVSNTFMKWIETMNKRVKGGELGDRHYCQFAR